MTRSTAFRRVVVCHTNDFRPDINDKIKGWIESNGGTFSKDLSPNVTHLVTSAKSWKRYTDLVRQGRRMKTVKIVKYDWLEDSLMKRPVRALPEHRYLWEQARAKPVKRASQSRRPAKDAAKISIPRYKRIETTGIEFDKAKYDFQQDMGSVGFHPYSDATGFVYIITLLRHDVLKNRLEKYKLKVGFNAPSLPHDIVPGRYTRIHMFPAPEPFSGAPVLAADVPARIKFRSCVHIAEPWAQSLQLYESDETPHSYACYVQYTRPSTSRQVMVLAPPGSTWSFSWAMFEKFFVNKVGIAWSQRAKNGTNVHFDGESDVHHFQYLAPGLLNPEGTRNSQAKDMDDICGNQSGLDHYTRPVIGQTPELDDTHLP